MCVAQVTDMRQEYGILFCDIGVSSFLDMYSDSVARLMALHMIGNISIYTDIFFTRDLISL